MRHRGKALVRTLVIRHRLGELVQIIQALGAPRRFTRRLDGRQQQRDQDADDGDDDEQLDQGKTV
jgi:hypothetical protein